MNSCKCGWFITVAVMAVVGVSANDRGGVRIVWNHHSDYVIYHAAHAPASVAEAAQELQRYVARSTGALLPIVSGGRPAGRFISLGDNRLLRSAGLAPTSRPEGFQIAVRHQNLFIFGVDTQNGIRLSEGGTSAGTRNGVYATLERFLGIRWLMPGAAGDDVPASPNFVVPEQDLVEFPGFANRRVPYIQNEREDVGQWSRRQRLGFSLQLNHAHNWAAVHPDQFQDHPSWFAARGGERVAPAGWYKLETTNQELVRAFAGLAVDRFRDDPGMFSYSLSPSDGGGWSDSVESRALYDKDPHGRLSVTPLILKFYNDVGRIVRQRVSGKVLCGYIYDSYLFPPAAGIPAIESNVFLVLAPSTNYGYQLFRSSTRAEAELLMTAWSRATPNIAYYDLPETLIQTYGAPTPPVPEILRFVYHNVHRLGMRGVYIYGVGSWGYGAVTNYVQARLAWNPEVDPDQLAREFLTRAYGEAAGVTMHELYMLIADRLRAFYNAHDDASFNLTPAMLRDVYATGYGDIERLYLTALSQTSDERQQRRLMMFGETLQVLRWNLVRLKMIVSTPSPLARSDTEIVGVVKEAERDLALDPAIGDAVLATLVHGASGVTAGARPN